MTGTLLDIVTTEAATVATNNLTDSVSLFDLILKGGWTMIPLAILSFTAIYIFIERYITINKSAKGSLDFVGQVKASVLAGNIEEAKNITAAIDSPAGKMINKGLYRIGSPMKTIEATVENVGKLEINRLEKNLPLLATIAGAGPMIGFLGTVIGMIQAFISIAQQEGSVSPKLLSAGIYEAMITTAAGLIVGIIAYISYNYLTAKIQKIIHAMEFSAIEFMDLLQEPQN